ncbi:MAG: helix-hairpin-helix domain-containing protein, partial [Candidatus Thorarchaeota archaeon]
YRYGDPTDLEERISKMIEDELSAQRDMKQYSSDVDTDTFDSVPIIEHSLPTGIIDGIGRNTSNLLTNSGVNVLEDLAEITSSHLMKMCDTDLETAERWIAEAKAIIFGAEIKSIMDLSVAHDEEIYQRVSDAVEKGIISFPDDYEFTLWVVKRWIESAIHHMTSVEPDEIRKWFDRER